MPSPLPKSFCLPRWTRPTSPKNLLGSGKTSATLAAILEHVLLAILLQYGCDLLALPLETLMSASKRAGPRLFRECLKMPGLCIARGLTS